MAPEMLEDEEIQMDDLKKDFAGAAHKLSEMKGFVEGKHLRTWLNNELIPVMGDLIDKLGQQEDALLAVFDENELILPETATALLAALAAGEQLAVFLEKIPMVDIQKAEAAKLIQVYRNTHQLAEKAIGDLVADEGEDEGGEEAAPADDGGGE